MIAGRYSTGEGKPVRIAHPFDHARLPIRKDAYDALGAAWRRLGGPGAWLTGPQRVAVAAEARHAWNCGLCRRRKDALSPYAVDGQHDDLGEVPAAWVDVIHRVVTDSGRLTRRWYQEARDAGVAEDEFVEIISVAIITTTVDAFAYGIGVDFPALPIASDGAPHRMRASEATPGPGWVATIAPENAGADFADFYANESHFYIRRSLTLVPDECRRFWELMNPLYMEDPRVPETEGLDRAISRAQIEFLAARASALLGCYY